MDCSEVVFKYVSVVLGMLLLHPKNDLSQLLWANSAHLFTVLYQMLLVPCQKICWFECHLGAVNGSGAVFEFVSVIFVLLILPP